MNKDINNKVTEAIAIHEVTRNAVLDTTWNAVLDASLNTTSWVIYDTIDFSSNFATDDFLYNI